MFELMIWGGVCLSLLGLAGLIWCIFRVARARRAGLQDDALRAVIQSVLPINMAAMFLSVIGLMLVVIGIILS
ncbi:MAG: hypothetical protein ACPG61_04175 [Paracoccaceae bacterium]|nr:hypothetical protein [Marinibacterium sp.]